MEFWNFSQISTGIVNEKIETICCRISYIVPNYLLKTNKFFVSNMDSFWGFFFGGGEGGLRFNPNYSEMGLYYLKNQMIESKI